MRQHVLLLNMRFSIAAAARLDEVAIQRRRRRSADARRSQSGNERDVHHQLAEEVPMLYFFVADGGIK
jgi:hypothetical protein